MIERIVVAMVLTVLVLAGPPVVAQSEKRVSGCERACREAKCPDQGDCVTRCVNCWTNCSAKGSSVGYRKYCSKACPSLLKRCWQR